MVKLIVSDQTEEHPETGAGGQHGRGLKPRGGVDEVELSLAKKIVLKLSGAVYMGHCTRPGWSGSLPFYVFECPVHGLVENYPQGYHGRLDCPLCLQEKTA
jgi:hypothetical protein